MEFLKAFLKLTLEFIVWTSIHFVWNPIKWVTTGTWQAIKNRKKKPKYKPTGSAANTQAAAATDLPANIKHADELRGKMKKLSEEYNELAAELKLTESLIRVAGGDFGQKAQPQRNNGNQQKQNNQKQNNGNNNQKQNQPAIAAG